MNNDQESFYDQFSSNEAPAMEQAPVKESRRQVDWMAAKNFKAAENVAEKVRTASTSTQKDLSYYAFNRYALSHPCIDSFEQSVNIQFGEVVTGHNWDDLKARYIALYKQMMEAA